MAKYLCSSMHIVVHMVDGSPVGALPFDAATPYLGRLFTFGGLHYTELRNRLHKVWVSFVMYKDEFSGHHYL